MKKIEWYVIGLFAVIILFVFRPYFFEQKILFPSNLLVTAYAPWKYEPVPEYPNGPPNKPMGFDDIREFFPNRKLLSESFAKGILPFWNPYIYSGAPFMAAFDTAVWYPLSWIAAGMSTVSGWNFLVIIQPILSLFFMYLFLKSLKFEPKIAAFGAFTYAFSGWMIVYWQEILVLEHSFLWLPLALYFANTQKFRLLVFALACSVFGGFLQMSIYVYAVVFLWNIFVVKSKRVYLAIALSLCIAAVQLISSVEAFLLSPRGTENGLTTFRNALLPLQHLITLMAPDFWGNPGAYNYFGGSGFYFEKMIYIGIIPLVFCVYAFFIKKEQSSRFFKILAVCALSMGFALPTSWLPYILRIPVLSNSYPTRTFAVFAFCAAVLACYGLQSFLAVPNRRMLKRILLFFTIVLLGLWAWAVWKHMAVSLRNLIIPSVLLFASWLIVSKYSQKIVYYVIFTITVLSSVYFAQKYIQFSDRRFVYPDLAVTREISRIAGYDRVWGYGNAFIDKNLPQYFKWFSSDGYGNLSSKRYAELISTIVNDGLLGGPIRRSDTDIYEISERDLMTSNPYRLRMMSLLGIKYILETKQGEAKKYLSVTDCFPDSLFAVVWENEKWRIWEYKEALPRAIYATNFLLKKDPQEIVEALYNPEIPLGSTVILEKNPGISLQPATGSAKIISYELNSVKVETNSTGDGFLVLTDNYYPGWNAAVDGQKTKIFRADYSFKAVFVPKGKHVVTFQYLPQSVIISGVISVVGVIAAFIL